MVGWVGCIISVFQFFCLRFVISLLIPCLNRKILALTCQPTGNMFFAEIMHLDLSRGSSLLEGLDKGLPNGTISEHNTIRGGFPEFTIF